MRISVLTLGAIASILSINSVFATTSTVTSKDYVDAADALKQNKIPATGTNASTPGSTVVTYTGTAGTIGERGICNDPTDNCNQADIATFGLVGNAVEYIQNNMPKLPTGTANNVVTYDSNGDIGGERGIYDGSTTYDADDDADKLVTASVVNNLPRLTTTTRRCYEWVADAAHTDANCLLWQLVDQNVYGYCSRNTNDCDWLTPSCDSGLVGCCHDNRCQCSTCTK